jgi:hypothetical protein
MWISFVRLLLLLLWTLLALWNMITPLATSKQAVRPWVADIVLPFDPGIMRDQVVSAVPTYDPAVQAVWREPASVWMQIALRLIAADAVTPPHAARNLMLLSIALHDSVLAVQQSETEAIALSLDAALSEAALRVLRHLHPLHSAQIEASAAQAQWMGVWRNEVTPDALLPSQQIGAAVADAVLAWAATDGAVTQTPMPLPMSADAGRWQPTPPNYASAQLPQWGRVRTVVIGDPAQLRVPAPPAWHSPTMDAERRQFRQAQQLRAADRASADYWAAESGTVTPPGMWMERAIQLVQQHDQPTTQAVQIYAALGIALHDSAVACWESKYTYTVARPIQDTNANPTAWQPYLTTPPHPSYPSGHASFSGAASTILAAYFPSERDQLHSEAEAAAWSRVLGGIHWPMDGAAGLQQGQRVAEQVLATR